MYDKKKVYDKAIEEHVSALIAICNDNEIPCFMTFATRQEENGEFICQGKSLLPEMFGIETESKMFSNFVNVQTGFNTIPPAKTEEIDFDDFQLPISQ